MKRSFASLDDFEALHVAIFIEERNAALYEEFARRFAGFDDPESPAIAATFREMAEQERSHSTRLQERYRQLFGHQGCTLTDADVADVIELPELPARDQPLPGRVTRRQALEVALAAERQARHYYAELAALTLDAPLRWLYRELANFERDHEEFLERKRATLRAHAS